MCLFKKFTNKDIIIKQSTSVKSDKSFYNTKKSLGYSFPKYSQMIEEMVNHIISKEHLYSHYKIKE